MPDPTVRSERRDYVGILTIDRPDALNALNHDTLSEFVDRLAEMEQDDSVRVIVITGGGERSFVAGGDVKEIAAGRGITHYLGFAEQIHSVFDRLEACDKPTIGAVNGYALGGGLELLLALDLRILSESAILGFPEIDLGLFPGAGGSQRIIRQLPLCIAKELLFTGERIGATQAVALGLVNKVVSAESLMEEALKLAERIASKSPLVLKLLKRTVRYGLEMPLSAALAHEKAMISLVLDSEDAHEGCDAFLQKRPAQFSGR